MATISSLAQLVTGYIQNYDLTVNDLQAQSFLVGTTSPVQITKTIAGRLVSLQNGTDVDATYHTHDTLYYRKTTLNSATGGSAGSTLIGDDNSYSNFTPTTATVKGALSGLDTTVGTFANKSLSNLTSPTSVNQDLIPSATTKKLGSAATYWLALYASLIKDSSDVTAVDVFNRLLKNPSAATLADWSGSVLKANAGLDFNSSKGINLSAGTVSSDAVNYGQVILTSGANPFAANQPMGSNKLTGLSAGTTAGDSVRYEQAILTSGVNAFAANQSMGGNRLTNVADPTGAQDAATRNYVDVLAQGITWKNLVRAATTGALAAYTYANGTAGVGATITANANGALAAQDGVTLVANDRLLVKNETAGNAPNNGIYVVTQVGSGGTPFILTRSTDNDQSTEFVGATVETGSEGATQAHYVFFQTTAAPITVGTSNISFIQISSGIAYTFNNGLSLTGSTVNVVPGDNSLTATAGSLVVKEDPAGAIVTGGSGIAVQLESSNPTLQISSNRLGVKLDAAGAIVTGASGIKSQVLSTGGIQISSNSLALLLADTSLATSGSGVQVNLATVSGLTVSSGLKVKLEASNPTLQIDGSNQLGVKLDPAGAIITGASGIKSQVLATGGLQISSNSLAILLQTSSGLVLSGSGLAANVDGSSITINGSNQLQANLTAVYVTLANNTGSTINAGDIVSADTTAGQVIKAKADSLADVQGMIGVAAASITNGTSGKIQVAGLATVTQGTAFTIGARVYLSSATAGQGTSTAPTAGGTFAAMIGVATSTTQVVLQPMLVGGN